MRILLNLLVAMTLLICTVSLVSAQSQDWSDSPSDLILMEANTPGASFAPAASPTPEPEVIVATPATEGAAPMIDSSYSRVMRGYLQMSQPSCCENVWDGYCQEQRSWCQRPPRSRCCLPSFSGWFKSNCCEEPVCCEEPACCETPACCGETTSRGLPVFVWPVRRCRIGGWADDCCESICQTDCCQTDCYRPDSWQATGNCWNPCQGVGRCQRLWDDCRHSISSHCQSAPWGRFSLGLGNCWGQSSHCGSDCCTESGQIYYEDAVPHHGGGERVPTPAEAVPVEPVPVEPTSERAAWQNLVPSFSSLFRS